MESMRYNYKIDFEQIQDGWGARFRRYPSQVSHSLDAEGYQLLEDVLNSHDLILNRDCFLVHEGRRVAEFQMTQQRQTRLAALDGLTKKLIRKEMFEHGASLKIEQVSRFNSYLYRVAQEMSQFFGLSVSCNLYVTPAYTRCFDTHFDGYDIIVLQLAGTKEWKISAPISTDEKTISFKGLKFKKDILSAGDVLFLPEGAVHEASTNEHASVHVTFGLHPITVATYLRENLSKSSSSTFFDECRQTVVVKRGARHSTKALDAKKIARLTSRFKSLLENLKTDGCDEKFNKDFLDLNNNSKFPDDLEITPSTTLAFQSGSKGIRKDILAEIDLKLMQHYRHRSYFYAGELLFNSSTKNNWERSIHLTRVLLKSGVLVICNPKVNSLNEPLGNIADLLKKSGFYPFYDYKKRVWVARLGKTEGYLSVPRKIIPDFIDRCRSDVQFLNDLAKKYAKA